jgi:hypothetical protein
LVVFEDLVVDVDVIPDDLFESLFENWVLLTDPRWEFVLLSYLVGFFGELDLIEKISDKMGDLLNEGGYLWHLVVVYNIK